MSGVVLTVCLSAQVVIYDDMSNGKNFNRGSAAVLVKDITVVDDFSYIVHKVRGSLPLSLMRMGP